MSRPANFGGTRPRAHLPPTLRTRNSRSWNAGLFLDKFQYSIHWSMLSYSPRFLITSLRVSNSWSWLTGLRRRSSCRTWPAGNTQHGMLYTTNGAHTLPARIIRQIWWLLPPMKSNIRTEHSLNENRATRSLLQLFEMEMYLGVDGTLFRCDDSHCDVINNIR